MIVKTLGVIDLLCAALVVLLQLHAVIDWRITFAFSGYLIAKGLIFSGDLNSFLDLMCGAYLILMIFGFASFISYAVAIYLFQKAVFSLA